LFADPLRAEGLDVRKNPARLVSSAKKSRFDRHGATDLSPITLGAALHFDTWVPNFGIQEYMRHTPETDAASAQLSI
jgi:mannonate dehydratase